MNITIAVAQGSGTIYCDSGISNFYTTSSKTVTSLPSNYEYSFSYSADSGYYFDHYTVYYDGSSVSNTFTDQIISFPGTYASSLTVYVYFSGSGGGGSSGGSTDPIYACYDVTTGTYINGWMQGSFGMTAPSYGSNYTYLGYCPGNSQSECLDYYTTNGTVWNTDSTYIVADASYVIFFYRQNVYYAYITYHYNNGSGIYTDGTQYTFSDTSSPFYIYLDTPSRSGYTFLGWTTDNSSNYVSSPLQAYSGSVYNLYAMWQRTYYYTYITYHYNGGSGSYTDGAQVGYSSTSSTRTINLDIPKRTDYTFLGWGTSTSSADIGKQLSVSSTSTVYKTLYAIWRRNTITITYNTNGGSGGPSSQTVNTNSSFNINGSTIPTKSGYIFKGWSTSSTAKTATYKKGATTSISVGTSNITFYAVWWPEFKFSTYSYNELNTLIGYINNYLGKSISTISSDYTLKLASTYNTIATALNSSSTATENALFTQMQMDALVVAYKNY